MITAETLRSVTDTLLGIPADADPNEFTANLRAARGIVAALLLLGDDIVQLRKAIEAKR